MREEPVRSLWMGVLKGWAAGELFYGKGWLGLTAVMIFPILWKKGKGRRREWERQQIGSQFKDALTALSFAVEVGYSMENAVGEAVKDLRLLYGNEARIVKEFEKLRNQLQVNITVESAFEIFAGESGNEDIEYFSNVLSLAKRNGGNLSCVIRSAAERIGQKIAVKEEIETIVSGKKMEQQVMMLIPYGMILYLRLTAPEFILPLYGSEWGIGVMTACLAVCLCAEKIGNKILCIQI